MLILDTNHFTRLVAPTPDGQQLEARLVAANQDIAITIVTVQESVKGWLDKIHTTKEPRHQIPYYENLGNLIDYLAS